MNLSFRCRLQIICFFLLFCGISSSLQSQDIDVPYVPTPHKVVEKMLDLSDIDSSDYVIDLGSGDGRIVIAAAKRGATGHGIELNPQYIAEARQIAASQEVEGQVFFKKADIFEASISGASVITLYLLPSVNKKLRPRLLEELRPGTRVVSHSFDMGGWKPDKKADIRPPNSTRSHAIYYWVIPAGVEGDWHWSVGDRRFSMAISQQYQQISVSIIDGDDRSYEIVDKNLKGDRISIRAKRGNTQYIFNGQISDNNIHGVVQYHSPEANRVMPWTARRP